MPTERASAAVVNRNKDIFVIGGETESNNEISLPRTEALDITSGEWRTLANLQIGRHGTDAIIYEGDLYIAAGSKTRGGTEISPDETYMEAFSFDDSPASSPFPEWTTLGEMLHARTEAQGIVYDGELFVFNGFGPSILIENSAEKYTPTNNQWTAITSVPRQRNGLVWATTHSGFALVGDTCWIVGGRVGNNPGPVTNQVWCYIISQNKWIEGPILPVRGGGGGLGRLGNKLHYVGGFDDLAHCDLDIHLVYDLDEPELGWQDITDTAPLPDARNHFGTVVAEGKLYVIGGQYGHDAGCLRLPANSPPGFDIREVFSYDPITNRWSRLADLPYPESHIEPSTFYLDGDIYVVGGQNQWRCRLKIRY